MNRVLVLSLLAACQNQAPVFEAPASFFGDEISQNDMLPPPTSIGLSGPAYADRATPVIFSVDRLDDGEKVFLLVGPAPGPGPCHRLIGGYCLDLERPVSIAGTAMAEPDGRVTVAADPAPWVGATSCDQAVAPRGPSGIWTGLSDVVCVEGCDDPDMDTRCDPVDAFPSDPLEWDDTDGDGVGDNSDVCPLDALDDRDGDGACDSDAPCPDDDRDGDGACDCVDPCPDDDTNGDDV